MAQRLYRALLGVEPHVDEQYSRLLYGRESDCGQADLFGDHSLDGYIEDEDGSFDRTVSTAKTRIERDFDPDSVRQMETSAGRNLTVGGPLLAHAFKAGLIDECHLFVTPTSSRAEQTACRTWSPAAALNRSRRRRHG